MIYQPAHFKSASAVWLRGYGDTVNCSAIFKAFVPRSENAIITLTAQSNYSLFINGKFVFQGPARAGHGFFRLDRLSISSYLTNDKNEVCILVNGYLCSNFYLINQKSFLCAEIYDGDTLLCATGKGGFEGYLYDSKLRRVQRYAFQRTFCEVYNFEKCPVLQSLSPIPIDAVTLPDSCFIEREVSYPDFEYERYKSVLYCGDFSLDETKKKFSTWWLDRIGKDCTGFLENELEFSTTDLIDKVKLLSFDKKFDGDLKSLSYVTLEMKSNITGLIYAEVECEGNSTLAMRFDEILSDGRVSYSRMDCVNAVVYKLGRGKYSLITAEPYTFKYIDLMCTEGDIRLLSFGVIRTDFNKKEIVKRLKGSADAQMKRIYDAAIETFCQNTYDIFMDCPSRERAGWLCDSFFTSRVEYLLTKKSTVEHSFLSNFVMGPQYANVPNGMLPMCYPADHTDRNFIPNWAMWYVIELKEYIERTGDLSFALDIKQRIYALLSYFKGFENERGLLTSLKGWIFVEWSECNNLTQDINYPTNMLYYLFKKTLAELYDDKMLDKDAENLKSVINAEARIGLFYCDNAVFDGDGVAHLSGKCTETCQYYAFFTGVTDFESDKELWKTLLNDFGPERKKNNKWKDIYFSNAFIGNYLRLDLLKRYGEKRLLDENIRGYFDYMAKECGTLWENDTAYASCNHGFASHVLVWLDYLGYLEDK